jgi:hypothetical protein
MSIPLEVGIDHVRMHVSYGNTRAIDTIERLAARHGLVIYDPQFGEVFRPAPPGHSECSSRTTVQAADDDGETIAAPR